MPPPPEDETASGVARDSANLILGFGLPHLCHNDNHAEYHHSGLSAIGYQLSGARRNRRDQAARSWLGSCSLNRRTRTAATVWAPTSLQRIPGPFSRAPMRCLQALSTMPEPISQPAA